MAASKAEFEKTTGRVITCRAAVAWHAKKLKVEEIDVAPPKAGEVRVKILFSGVCHTDLEKISGDDKNAPFPFIPGHEGSGIVESIGEGVKTVKPGDHVVPIPMPQCNECHDCKSKVSNVCDKFHGNEAKGLMDDGTSRFSQKGKDIYHLLGCSTFSEYTVVNEINLIKVDERVPLEKACLFGCGIPTGYGAPFNNTKVFKGATVGVWGLGCIGLAVVMGCRDAGAGRIIAVDPSANKYEIAKQFGATECMNPDEYKKQEKTLPEVIASMTDNGLDFSFECTGKIKAMEQAFESCRKGWGECVILGVAPTGKTMAVDPSKLLEGRVLRGSLLGGWKTREQVPKLIDMYTSGRLKADEFITHRFQLEDINEAFTLLDDVDAIRSIITVSQAPITSSS